MPHGKFPYITGISTAIRNAVTSRRLVAIDVSIAAVGYSGNSKISYKKCILWLQQALYISTANETSSMARMWRKARQTLYIVAVIV